jgi:hypothetical protein
MTQIDFPRLQLLLETVRVLQQRGLTGEGILQTFFSRGVQSHHQREAPLGASLGPSCLICPSLSLPDAIGAGPRVQETLSSRDVASQEVRNACCERLRLQRLKRWVESDLELMCSWVACVGQPSPVALASPERGILHLAQVSPFGQKIGDEILLACY